MPSAGPCPRCPESITLGSGLGSRRGCFPEKQETLANGSQNVVPQREPGNLVEKQILRPHPRSRRFWRWDMATNPQERKPLSDGHQNQCIVMIMIGVIRGCLYRKMPGPHRRPVESEPQGKGLLVGPGGSLGDIQKGDLNLSSQQPYEAGLGPGATSLGDPSATLLAPRS